VHNSVKLKISTNSTRRVRWYAKLGFYKNSTLPLPITLESVLPHGGIIGSLSLVILRKYPIMFLEKKTNTKSSKYKIKKYICIKYYIKWWYQDFLFLSSDDIPRYQCQFIMS